MPREAKPNCDPSKTIKEMQRAIAQRSADEIMRNITNPYFNARQGELHAVLVRIVLGSHYLMNGGD